MEPFDYALSAWAVVNLALFAILLVRSNQVRRRARSRTVRTLAVALILVSISFILGGVELMVRLAFGEWLVNWSGFASFLIGWQILVATAVTLAALFAVMRLSVAVHRIGQGQDMIEVMTTQVPLDASVSEWRLTARELQVLELIALGKLKDTEIAEDLYISESTAATHVRNILHKSGLTTRRDLMLVAQR